MQLTKKAAFELINELAKTESKLHKWRRQGVALVVTQETLKALKESTHPKRDFVLQGVLADRRGAHRY